MNLKRPETVNLMSSIPVPESIRKLRPIAGLEKPVNEADWIRRLQRGDLKALEALYERYKDQVYRVALAVCHDDKRAEDILQECFLRLYRTAALLDAERPLAPWLYRMTVNLTYDCLDRERRTFALDNLLEWLTTLSAPLPGPDASVEHNEQLRLVREVVRNLPHAQRVVVVLFYMESLSVEDIARILNVPEGTVKSRLHTARQALRQALQQKQRLLPQVAYEYT